MKLLANFVAAILVAVVVATPASAATRAELDTLVAAMGVPRLMEIMREEGIVQAAELREGMFPGRAGGWEPVVSAIYDTDEMTATFRGTFDRELADDDITPLIEFFASDLGSRIIDLELAGREALLDPAIEEAAIEAWAAMRDDRPERAAAVAGFVDANDLVEFNVMGAMNASLSFYKGLADGGGFDIDESRILADVWGQETEIRADSEQWLHAYLAMAYEPLTDAEIARYVEFSATPEGRALNSAIFAGFDVLFRDISYALGRAASRFAMSEDL